MADNDMQSYGAQLLCEMLNENDAILSVNVSGEVLFGKMERSIQFINSYFISEIEISVKAFISIYKVKYVNIV
jgi:hypothetical protein